MGIKADFITALRDLPDGIKNFLETPIPEFAPTTLPVDKDSANLAVGILAHNLNTWVGSMAGLMFVALVLRVGQHSNPLEAITLAVLEYIQDANKDHKIELQHPETGKAYLPGDLSIVVKGVNGEPKRVVAIMENTSVELNGQAGFWVGTVTLETEADYTLNVTASYEKGDDATSSAAFTIALTGIPENPTPEPPGGKDKAAINKAFAACEDGYRKFLGILTITPDPQSANVAYQSWKTAIDNVTQTVNSALGTQASAIGDDLSRLSTARAQLSTAIVSGTANEMIYAAGALESIIKHIQAITSSLLK